VFNGMMVAQALVTIYLILMLRQVKRNVILVV
jgi:hypothetical protein